LVMVLKVVKYLMIITGSGNTTKWYCYYAIIGAFLYQKMRQ